MRSSIYVIGLGVLVSCSGDGPWNEEQLSRESALADRQQLAASGRFLVPRAQGPSVLSDASMLAALDIPAGLNPVITTVSPDPNAVFDAPRMWRINPSRGGSLLVLSTGRTGVATTTAEPGVDFAPSGPAGDLSQVRIELDAPPGADMVSFDYTFLSSESPEYVNSQYNDTFTATVSDAISAGREIAMSSVNSAQFHEASETRVGVGPFLLYTDDYSNVDTVFGAENFPPGIPLVTDAGTTDLQRVSADIRATGRITLEFTIQDLGDGILDSAVLIDNVSFSSLQIVDPNTAPAPDGIDRSLIDQDGRLVTDPVLLADQERGVVVDRIAADGSTRVLLRRSVARAGAVTFSLNAANLSDGGFAPFNGFPEAPAWRDSATVGTEVVGGVHYAFAWYKAPEDFVAVADAAAAIGQVGFSVQFTPTNGAAQPAQAASFEIVRPPVVVVPDLWSNCTTWSNSGSIMQPVPAGFSMSCASYDFPEGPNGSPRSSLPLGFSNLRNQSLLPDHVGEQLRLFRNGQRAAVTQVDVVGHGMGGLFARRYIDSATYRGRRDFNEGTVNRLVTIGTSHLGARFADEAVRFREAMVAAGHVGSSRNWTSVNSVLAGRGIRMDKCSRQVALDEMMTSSPVLQALGVSPVPSHAIVSAGGHDATRPQWLSAAGGGPVGSDLGTINQLFTMMERYHPLSLQNPADPASDLLSQVAQYRLLHQPIILPDVPAMQSKIFCAIGDRDANDADDDNDFYATVQEQRGGLDWHAVTLVPVVPADFTSAHFKANYSPAHRNAILTALNSPIVVPADAPPGTQSKFAAFMPAPATLIPAKGNRCPIPYAMPGPQVCPNEAPAQAAVSPFAHTLEITQPANGTSVAPGSVVTMTVATGLEQPDVVILSDGIEAVERLSPPFTATFTIPADAFGTVQFTALAFYSDGEFVDATPVTLQVQSTATLTGLSVLNGDAVILRPGRTRQLTVIGTYNNGARRNLTSGQLGTRYAVSSIGTVASVGQHGLVTGLAPGNATLVVRNGNHITSINVEVGAGQCGDGELDPGEQCDDGGRVDGDGCDRSCRREEGPTAVCASPTVCNDVGSCSAEVSNLGAGSFDPDGVPVTITQTPPGPYSVGDHTVAVNVSNGTEDAQCTSDLSVLDCERPSLTCAGAFAVECTGNGGAQVNPPPASSSDNCGVQLTSPAGGFFPLGVINLAYRATDPAGNQSSCTTSVTVQDTQAPTVGVTSPSPLFPVDGEYRTFNLSDCGITVQDTCGGSLTLEQAGAQITCVTADEVDDKPNNPDDGNTVNDIVIVSPTQVKVRAERLQQGDGRVYEIKFRVRDASGNIRDGVCPVAVPAPICYPRPGFPGCGGRDNGDENTVCSQ